MRSAILVHHTTFKMQLSVQLGAESTHSHNGEARLFVGKTLYLLLTKRKDLLRNKYKGEGFWSAKIKNYDIYSLYGEPFIRCENFNYPRTIDGLVGYLHAKRTLPGMGVGFFWGGGLHESRRLVKCQDHAWRMLSKLKGNTWFQKVV